MNEHIAILLVDDNDVFRNALQEWLHETHNWIVDAVNSGEEALERLQSATDPYDVVLLDKVLHPLKMDGLATLRAIRERYPSVKVIMFTMYDPKAGLEALQAGAYRYITRPFTNEDLASLVSSVIQPETALQKTASTVSKLLNVPVCLLD